ncbi:hypothetical protein [Corynebacterium sp. HMSC055D05]|uniref:hypothetical protein n=1 Tax=Corynebacterium sp. HMSC055D05 TaxID=1715213 RepID=UPI0008A1E16A|nr:hypothetical protein [Corynebacterium sp. HMSC055D05]OFL90862.1 hypothetical protein HMPREF2734_02860 [Corynebacterium sp. HMSC055D05]
MIAVLLVLAFVALAAGVALFIADARERSPRRAWARQHGFTFAKVDDLLAAEWRRGAASAGATAREVVSGSAFGHDLHLADLGETTVLAVPTGREADVVVDMRRDGFEPTQRDDDLVEATREGAFTVHATSVGPARRLIDDRVRTALSTLPPAVNAVWFEGAWVIAQFAPGSTAQDWDASLAAVALLADAARTLPPVEDAPLWVGEEKVQGVVEKQAGPERPEDPVELPTRVTGGERGEVEERDLGGDDVAAIAGDERTGTDLTRVKRVQGPSSIFDSEEK